MGFQGKGLEGLRRQVQGLVVYHWTTVRPPRLLYLVVLGSFLSISTVRAVATLQLKYRAPAVLNLPDLAFTAFQGVGFQGLCMV